MPFLLLEVRCKKSKECQSTEVFHSHKDCGNRGAGNDPTLSWWYQCEVAWHFDHFISGARKRNVFAIFFWSRRLIWKKTNFPGTSRVQNIQSSGLKCTHCCVKVFARKRIFDIISKDTLPWLDVFGNKEVSNSCTRVSWHPSSASLVRYVPQNCFENGWLESSFFFRIKSCLFTLPTEQWWCTLGA